MTLGTSLWLLAHSAAATCPVQWPSHELASGPTGGLGPALVDVDVDGDLDVFSTIDDDVLWFDNPGDGDLALVGVAASLHLLVAPLADFDSDGDLDLFGIGATGPEWVERNGLGF